MRALILILLFSFAAKAHNPLIASFTISQQNGLWMIDMNLAQGGVHEALKLRYPDKDFETMDAQPYKELLVAYLKETCKIEANGKPVLIGGGGIKLGSHETNLRFMLDGLAGPIKEMNLAISCFSENEGQQNIISIIQDGHKRKYFAQKDNDYTLKLQADQEGRLGEVHTNVTN